ncbi:hypothetical protein ACQEU3_05090 [Spirillospora sp. CA-253888]
MRGPVGPFAALCAEPHERVSLAAVPRNVLPASRMVGFAPGWRMLVPLGDVDGDAVDFAVAALRAHRPELLLLAED